MCILSLVFLYIILVLPQAVRGHYSLIIKKLKISVLTHVLWEEIEPIKSEDHILMALLDKKIKTSDLIVNRHWIFLSLIILGYDDDLSNIFSVLMICYVQASM